MKVTEQDKLNNPGEDPEQITEVKSQYHFHKLSSVTLSSHTLTCTFVPDVDPSSIFYTPEECNKAPVREYKINEEGEVEIMPDGLAVGIKMDQSGSEDEIIITSEEIWENGQRPEAD